MLTLILFNWTPTHAKFFIAGFICGFAFLPFFLLGIEISRSIVRRLLGRD